MPAWADEVGGRLGIGGAGRPMGRCPDGPLTSLIQITKGVGEGQGGVEKSGQAPCAFRHWRGIV
jgi:hypothetical protein